MNSLSVLSILDAPDPSPPCESSIGTPMTSLILLRTGLQNEVNHQLDEPSSLYILCVPHVQGSIAMKSASISTNPGSSGCKHLEAPWKWVSSRRSDLLMDRNRPRVKPSAWWAPGAPMRKALVWSMKLSVCTGIRGASVSTCPSAPVESQDSTWLRQNLHQERQSYFVSYLHYLFTCLFIGMSWT